MTVHGRLSALQDAVLEAFFASERGFFLSGGGALVGFHLQHRETTDLDLFTSSAEAFERARLSLPHLALALGGSLVVRQDAPGFRRVVVQRGSDSLVVDLVRDIGPQLHEKQEIDGIIVDPVEEIFSNKLTTLVSRQEVRDLIDVLELERRGLHAEDFLVEANTKDGGCTPATLAWLLTEWQIPPMTKLPVDYTVDQLRAFKAELAERMAIAAHPR
ncbi:MAG TPA: nucleotidyl transferase AbiEii/AbiGii toxin family protein [Polyangiaceae bacterium]|nr:nucleotidyl transferase AbiEii/AbiGii toxin family protein [Polyangiaceae bacterium]